MERPEPPALHIWEGDLHQWLIYLEARVIRGPYQASLPRNTEALPTTTGQLSARAVCGHVSAARAHAAS